MSNGKRINLFREKKKPKKVDHKVFDMMTSVADKTNVDINDYEEIPKNKESIHNALMVAGMTPGIGNIADITDATLYALEGEFGNAAWSVAAAIPVIGQMIKGKKALKVAKEAGEEMVTLYRGVEKWYPGRMVREGKFVGGGGYDNLQPRFGGVDKSDKSIWLSKKKYIGEEYSGAKPWVDKKRSGPLLEFEVPKSYIKEFGKYEGKMGEYAFQFQEGIPKEFLKKVHK